jgi:hypothetical protein
LELKPNKITDGEDKNKCSIELFATPWFGTRNNSSLLNGPQNKFYLFCYVILPFLIYWK